MYFLSAYPFLESNPFIYNQSYYLDISSVIYANETGCHMESYMNHPFQPVLCKRIIYQYFIWLTTFLEGIYNENSGIFVSPYSNFFPRFQPLVFSVCVSVASKYRHISLPFGCLCNCTPALLNISASLLFISAVG